MVQQAETIAPYGDRISDDYPRYTAGTAMLETAERLTAEEKEPATQQFLLLVGGLRTLADGSHAPGLVLDAFLLRSLAVAGYAASFEDCARCTRPGPHPFFNVPPGERSAAPAGRPARCPRPADPRPARRTALRRLGDAPTPATRGTAARAAGWWRRTCSGTWSAACARCRWSSAPRRDLTGPRSLSLVSPTEE